MKSKYPKEYSNLRKMDINVLKRRNELSSSRSFDSQDSHSLCAIFLFVEEIELRPKDTRLY